MNATVALLLALRSATITHFRHAKDTLGNAQVTASLADVLKVMKVVVFKVRGLLMAS